MEELEVEPDDDKLRRSESNLLRRVTTTNSNRIAKITLNCGPNGRRRLVRPEKTIRIGRNRSIRVRLVTDDDDDDKCVNLDIFRCISNNVLVLSKLYGFGTCSVLNFTYKTLIADHELFINGYRMSLRTKGILQGRLFCNF